MKTELQLGGGEGFTMEQQARYDAKVRVDRRPGIVQKARTERLDLTFTSRGTTLTYESLKPEDQETPLGRHVRATMNRLVDLTLDDRGRIDASVNVEFISGVLKDVVEKVRGVPDVVITDPPRAGMHEDVVRRLMELGPRRISYVSCNPTTQARDCAILAERYSVDFVQPVDMFPQTYHIETVARLTLR